MKFINLISSFLLALLYANCQCIMAQDHLPWAETPPMGWMSYACFGAAVTEAEVRGNAKMMELHLKDAGWEYVLLDYCWFYPYVGALKIPVKGTSHTVDQITDFTACG